MHMRASIRRLLVAATAAAAVALPTAVPANAASSDAGLYGAADPTYDGVFRQSLAILGLAANDLTPPATAVEWLLRQQCADGSFQAYRADTSVPCAKPDPAAFTGPDTNSTSLGFQALMAIDDSRIALGDRLLSRVVTAADRAGAWLGRQQNADGGWPYYSGGASDANSTGLALAGLNSLGGYLGSAPYRKASRFLGGLSASCADGGGFAYQAGSRPDGSATSQGTLGLVGGFPATRQPAAAVAAPCANTAKAKGISYLARGLRSTGVLESSFGGPDYTSTATAVVALAEARQGRASIAKGVAALKANAAAYATPSAGTSPGAVGMLLMVAEVSGTKPTSFGGLNLVSTLNSSLRK